MKKFVIVLLLVLCSANAQSQQPPTNEKKQIEEATTHTKNITKKATQGSVTGVRVTNTDVGKLARYCQINTENGERSEGLMCKFFNDPTAIFTGLLFLATVALWLATRRLVYGAESTAEQQLRAYVFTKHDQPATESDEGYFIASIMVKNFGQTPAKDLTSYLHISLQKLPLTIELDPPIYEPTSSKSPLAPGEQVLQDITFAETLNKSEIEAIIKEEGALFIHGELLYTDVFNKKRFTRFCLYSTGQAFKHGKSECVNDFETLTMRI